MFNEYITFSYLLYYILQIKFPLLTDISLNFTEKINKKKQINYFINLKFCKLLVY